MFNVLIYVFHSFSDGEEFITSNQLITKLREVEKIENKTEKLPQIEAKKSQQEGNYSNKIIKLYLFLFYFHYVNETLYEYLLPFLKRS